MSQVGIQFGTMVREHRKRLGLTQPDVARFARITVSTLSLVENGKANCTFELAERIGAVVGVELVPRIRNAAQPTDPLGNTP
jgi:transcriptional regulator with XRE-family HTH domain